MTPPTRRSTPRLRDVLIEQVRIVGLALRWPAAVAAALLGLVALIITSDLRRAGQVIDFHPEQLMLPGMVAFLLPIGVWKGEGRFGLGLLWTLPVDRRLHALTRVCAGWLWLMAAVALFVLFLFVLSVASGERILAEETLRLLPAGQSAAPRTLDAGTLRAFPTVAWTPQPLLWLAPFTGATGAYLFASAVALGTRHPLRWIVGIVLGLFLMVFVGEAGHVGWLQAVPDVLFRPLLIGPYGLDTLLTARTEFLKVGTILTTGESAVVWRGPPDLGQWAASTLLWTAAGVLALWAAASRHRERRRG